MKRPNLVLMSVGTLVLTSMCGGCIMGVKPATDTVLHMSRVSSSGNGKQVQSTLGFEYVYFDTLQNGYGVTSTSYHPRDHETYLFLFYDKYSNSPYTNCGYRRLLITPIGKPSQDRRTVYRLELYLPDSVLYPGIQEPGSYHRFAGTIGPPAQEAGERVRFNLDNVKMTSRDPQPITVRLGGTIVAGKDSPSDFEYRLKEWNRILLQEERPNDRP